MQRENVVKKVKPGGRSWPKGDLSVPQEAESEDTSIEKSLGFPWDLHLWKGRKSSRSGKKEKLGHDSVTTASSEIEIGQEGWVTPGPHASIFGCELLGEAV